MTTIPLARVALVGAGSIAASYVEGLRLTPGFEVVAVCGRRLIETEAFAQANYLLAQPLKTILADPTINYVLNLTPADAHAEVTRTCLIAGKSVYSEKPLATTLEEADALIGLAKQCGLLLACAPATILWPPLATARRLVSEGALGRIVGGLATLTYRGPELFHLNPAQFYTFAAGPLKDMGVYQIAALISLIGPVHSVSAMASRARAERNVLVGPDRGKVFPVAAQTHVNVLLRHCCGAISTIIVSFDGISASVPRLELFGDIAGLCIENVHRHDARVLLGVASALQDTPLDGPEWSKSQQAIGPASAWNAFHKRLPCFVNAGEARRVLAILLAIETACANGGTVGLS